MEKRFRDHILVLDKLRYSREKFLKLREKHKSGKKMSPCEFLSLNKLSFGCKGESPGGGTRPGRQTRWGKAMNRPRFGVSHVDRHFKELQERLKQAKIEATDFRNTTVLERSSIWTRPILGIQAAACTGNMEVAMCRLMRSAGPSDRSKANSC